jgi:hypothetical protein
MPQHLAYRTVVSPEFSESNYLTSRRVADLVLWYAKNAPSDRGDPLATD